ncbi:hypothetical protein TSTA_097540 [Talaromyces stipitatus ATCC 10500]|uniref:Uncharacterized protein n=1 Tax=Talaromyces stipitatus (strain ATCC 10500 / CBS 375.48 / QM 6759 / NRRL 1006) TaxID=441959 RepID=B8MLY6_TALSN|nr:uncharacterized protein TSTA_097540 [Talaromyces stipitatus ATCC 10500]EED13498.1 hypothetical protein TSTA_097540 [Talaromyces stipitatus ATCC 10500]
MIQHDRMFRALYQTLPAVDMIPNTDNRKSRIHQRNNVVLQSTMSFLEINSGELNSDAREDLLSQFTNYNGKRNRRWHPDNDLIHEEATETQPNEGPFVDLVESISSRSSPDPLK